jgi:hypothetical protein
MNRAACILLAFCLTGVGWAQDGAVRIEEGKRVEVTIPGAIIAFSRRSNARVLADDGSVYIVARKPGATELVVLTPAQVLRFHLLVSEKTAPPRGPALAPKRGYSAARPEVTETSPPAEQIISSVEGENVPLRELAVEPIAKSDTSQAEVHAGRTSQIVIPGATGAIAVDPEVLEASAANGIVSLSGRAPGRAEVLIVTPGGLKNIFVLVSPSPPAYPPGFVPPAAAAEGDKTGSYEFRYSSNPRQIQDRLDYTIRKPGLTTQLHLLNVDFLTGTDVTGESRSTLPSGFYRMTTPGWDLLLFDETVKSSPLTMDGVIVRGIHFRSHHWVLHAGYSSLATFSNFLIPTQREGVFGLSHVVKLSTNSELTQNAYYFPTPPKADTAGQPGGIGSVEYKLQRPQGLQLMGELGFSHGLGAAGDLQWSDKFDLLHFEFREKPPNFASVSLGNLPGSASEFAWSRKISKMLSGNTTVSENHLILPEGAQTNITATTNLQFKLSPRWSLSSGASYADFTESGQGTNSSVHSLSLPEQVNFDVKNFGAGFEYQLARTSGSLAPGQDFRGTTRISRGALQVTAFVERQTEALSVSSLYSQIPTLQAELQRLGLTAIQPSQLMTLLQDDAFLLALGYAQPTTLNLVPVRVEVGASSNWTSGGPRPSRLSLDFTRSQDQSLLGDSNNWVQSGSYTKALTKTNELSLSYSWFHYAVSGQALLSRQFEVSLRHSLSNLPAFLSPGAHGNLTGLVFEDDDRRGVYDPHMRTLAGVELVLDGWRHTETDAKGRYAFTQVPAGDHTIEAKFESALPHWFTTPSVASVAINTSTDFGITFALCELIGYVKNDAGEPIQNVEIDISNAEAGSAATSSTAETKPGEDTTAQATAQASSNTKKTTAQTDADGRFDVSGLAPGEYQLEIDPNTVPAGYVVEELAPLRVQLEKGLPRNSEFRVRAIRTFSGIVTSYDPKLGRYAPLAGATVAIPSLSLHVLTNDSGAFQLHDLPAGDYILNISSGSQVLTPQISIPADPVELNETYRFPQLNR